MIMKRCPAETSSKILRSALMEISRKGFSDATIRQIAKNAKVTALTVFRHFTDKENLFTSVLDEFSLMTIDEVDLNSKLSFSDLEKDLLILAKEYFKIIFANLDILRIFINESFDNPLVQKEAWFVSPVLVNHFQSYLNAMNLGKENKEELSEIFVAHITRRVLEYNTHDSIWEHSLKVEKDFVDKIGPQLALMKQIL